MIRVRHFLAVCALAAVSVALGQSADAPATGPSVALPDAKTLSQEPVQEQVSRLLTQLKAEHVAATAKFAADDPRMIDLDHRIAALREQIASDRQTAAMQSNAPAIAAIADSGGTSGAVSASDPAMLAPGASGASESPKDQAARHALEILTYFKMDHQPLSVFVDQLREQTHANIWVNWQALEAAGIDKQTPVSLNLAGVDGARALKLALDAVGGGTVNLGSTIDDGIVTITTREDLNSTKYQEIRVYNVRDLLTVDTSAYPPQWAAAIQQEQSDNLVDLIRSAVAPDSWREAGGTVGTIREFNGLLVINQTHENFKDLEGLLAKIRAAH